MNDVALDDPDGGGAPEVTVVLGDHEVATRVGARAALEAQGIRVVAEADTAREVVAAAVKHKPDVCLLAVHLHGGGIPAAEAISQALPNTKIVMLTGSERDEDLFAAIRAGADGYLLKSTSARRLPEAVRGVLAGEAAIPRRLVARIIYDYRARGRRRLLHVAGSGRPVELTAREFEVIMRLRNGDTTAEAARDLRISEVTVRRHVSSIEHKLGAPNRRAALAMIREADPDSQHGRP